MIFKFTLVCPSTEGLTNLSGRVSCNLDAACSKMKCCVDVEDLVRTMEVLLSIDHCNSILTIELERLSEDISLIDYNWGKSKNGFGIKFICSKSLLCFCIVLKYELKVLYILKFEWTLSNLQSIKIL